MTPDWGKGWGKIFQIRSQGLRKAEARGLVIVRREG